MGSCISTLVSRTNNLLGPVPLVFLGLTGMLTARTTALARLVSGLGLEATRVGARKWVGWDGCCAGVGVLVSEGALWLLGSLLALRVGWALVLAFAG